MQPRPLLHAGKSRSQNGRIYLLASCWLKTKANTPHFAYESALCGTGSPGLRSYNQGI
jgi:hypothetical protein